MKIRSSVKILSKIFCILFYFYISCGPAISQNAYNKGTGTLSSVLEKVNADSISKTIIDLQNFKTRHENTEGRKAAAQYIYARLKKYGYEVTIDPFAYHTSLTEVQNPTNTPNIYVFTETGFMLVSNDKGKNWHIERNNINWSPFILDEFHWWRNGDIGKIFRSNDGGQTWSSHSIGTNDILESMFFVDSLKGWLSGIGERWSLEGGKVFKTTDGGISWDLQYQNKETNFNELFFTTPDFGFAICEHSVVATTSNGGSSWNFKKLLPNGFFKIRFINSNIGFILGATPRNVFFYKTVDGGNSWAEKVYNDEPGAKCIDLDFSDSKNGWAVTRLFILNTQDGGETWQIKRKVKRGRGAFFRSIVALDKNSCVAINSDSVYCTLDGGETWNVFSPSLLDVESENIIAYKQEIADVDSVVIVGAHYDSESEDPFIYAPGADDNASGVAGMIEMARILRQYNYKYSLEFIAFGAEESGLHGSEHYCSVAKSAAKNIKAMINFDMIAFTNKNKWEINISSDSTCASLLNLANNMTVKYTNIIPEISYAPFGSDFGHFLANGYPAIIFRETAREGKIDNVNMHLTSDEFSILTIPFEVEVVKAALATLLLL